MHANARKSRVVADSPQSMRAFLARLDRFRELLTVDAPVDVDFEVAACLARCALFVGNDSGLMHLAAAAGFRLKEQGLVERQVLGEARQRQVEQVHALIIGA